MPKATVFARPPLLRPGARVRLIAPSGPVPPERFQQGVACLREWELIPVYEQDILSREAYLAGSDQRRRRELEQALADEQAIAIWCARGGYGATRLLPELTLDCIGKQNLIGFSDVSVLHALWQRAGKQSVHACNITGLSEWSEADRNALYQGLFTGRWPALTGRMACGHGAVRGPVLGGNLTVLAALAGTGFLPSFRDAIVFFEDVAERPYRLDRSLTQLVQSGALAGAVGFVIGQLTDCQDPSGKEQGRNALDAILDVLAPLGKPILAEVSVGHERTSAPLPLGADMILDPASAQLRRP